MTTNDIAASARMELFAPRQLDDKGRCCGKKPLVYKSRRETFCTRCRRAHNLETGKQVANWSYKAAGDGNFLSSFVDETVRRHRGPSLGFVA